MPKFERFEYDPMIVDGGGVRWENSVVLTCDPRHGRRVARALNAALQGEYKAITEATNFDVMGDIVGGKPVIALHFNNDQAYLGISLTEKETERLIRMIRYEFRQLRLADKKAKKGKK